MSAFPPVINILSWVRSAPVSLNVQRLKLTFPLSFDFMDHLIQQMRSSDWKFGGE